MKRLEFEQLLNLNESFYTLHSENRRRLEKITKRQMYQKYNGKVRRQKHQAPVVQRNVFYDYNNVVLIVDDGSTSPAHASVQKGRKVHSVGSVETAENVTCFIDFVGSAMFVSATGQAHSCPTVERPCHRQIFHRLHRRRCRRAYNDALVKRDRPVCFFFPSHRQTRDSFTLVFRIGPGPCRGRPASNQRAEEACEHRSRAGNRRTSTVSTVFFFFFIKISLLRFFIATISSFSENVFRLYSLMIFFGLNLARNFG